jgi:prepilin-type N-terminal cleavage/methylation domain-containing protein
MQSRGFTLIELMMVVVVAGFVLAMAIPAFGSFRDTMLLGQARSQVQQDLRMARQVAVTRHCPVLVSFGNGSTTTDVTNYTIHFDTNGDRTVQSGERRFYRTMPSKSKLSRVTLSPVDTVEFDMSGVLWPGTTGGTIVLRTPRGKTDTLLVSAAGIIYRP